MDLFGKSPRPTFNEAMRLELAKEIGKEVFDWCNGDTPLEDCISDCNDIFKYHVNDNGYELAKEFEDKGYSPDPQLVEILDGVWSAQSDLIRKAVKKWVIEDKIEPTIEVGASVIVQYGHKKVEGVITGTYPETAEYKVMIPSEGMTLEGSKRAIIKYENAELIKNVDEAESDMDYGVGDLD